VNAPTVASGFTIASSGANFPDFDSAHSAAVDGDTILVSPTLFQYALQGWDIWKNLTVRSATPGKRYALAIQISGGTIGSGITFNGTRRKSEGLPGRLVAAVEDAEIYANGLTFITGKCAVYVQCPNQPGNKISASVDATLRRCFIHDYDQGIETDNEYDWTDRTSTFTLVDSIVYQTGCIAGGDNNHSLYIGQIGSLAIRGSIIANKAKPEWTQPVRSPAVYGSISGPNYWPVGHLVKSRAKITTIEACQITGQDSANSTCIECPNGGDLTVTGSYLEQGSNADSIAFISFGRQIGELEVLHTGNNERVSKDGRTNRVRVYQNTMVNSDFNVTHTQQFCEVSYRTTQAFWTSQGFGSAPATTHDIRNNVFVDNANRLAIPPAAGWPNVGGADPWGIACVNATDNALVQYSALKDITQRYAGWVLAAPVTGTTNYASFALSGVTVANYARQSPTSARRRDASYGATQAYQVVSSTQAPPSWYLGAPLNAWSRLPVTSVLSEVITPGNPNGIVWPSTGVNEPFNPGLPRVAGKQPLPGTGAQTYVVFSGGRMIQNLSFVRNGVTYSGNYWVRYGGGHAASPDNSLHAIGPFDGTPKRINITDPSTPPAVDLVSDGNPQATFAPDGRPGAAHTYNSFAYLRSLNTLVIGQGAGYEEARGVTYGYKFDEDGYATPSAGWVNNQAYYSNLLAGTQEAAWMTDNSRGEVWSISLNTGMPLIAKASFTLGSAWEYVEIIDLALHKPPYQMYWKGWALEGERWLVLMCETIPGRWYVIDRDYAGSVGAYGVRRRMFEVSLSGDSIPAGPTPGNWLGIDGMLYSGAAFNFEDREFYVWTAGSNASTVERDIWRIVPPPEDDVLTAPWIVTKVSSTGGITPDAPFGSLQYMKETGDNRSGGWAPYGNFEYCPSPTKGIFFHHRLDVPPIFWRLP